jgi:hypothetical protein
MSAFITPRVVSTISQSRIDYNQSMTSLLRNFSGSSAPTNLDINLEGSTGLQTGMFWYKSGGNSSLGQNRLLVYNGSSFTRNGIGTFQMSSVAAAETAAQAGNIEYGDLVLIGTDVLYMVNPSGTGVIPISADASTVEGLSASQFVRSDIDSSVTGNTSFNSNNFVKVPIGTTAQRPQGTSARPGHIRYNTELLRYEGYHQTSWDSLGSITAASNSTNFSANVLFVADDARTVYVNSGLKFNPSTGTLTTTTFSGALTGTASISTTARITTSSAASNYKVPFADTTVNTTGNYGLLQDSGSTFTYNPSTNTLTVDTLSGAVNGNATTATTLQTARTIGGVSFNGSANINLPGVNTTGNQNTTGSAATLTTARTINGTSFNGSANITTANWGTTRTIWGQSINGSENITAPVRPSAGSVSAPAFSTSGDTNTGIYFSSADTLNVTTGGTLAATFASNGAFTAVGDVTAFSDARLKKDIQPIANALDKLESLTGYTFERLDTGERQTGVIAQEVQLVLPEAVNTEGEYLSVAYGNMIGLLIEAIKEQQVQIRQLKSLLEI